MRTAWTLALLVAAGCGGDGGANALCAGVTGTCKALPAGTSEADVQRAFVTASPDTTLSFGAGTFKLTNGINCAAVDGLTVKGAGMDQTVLDFSGQMAGSQGLYCNRDRFTIQDLTVQDTFGDAVKIEGSAGVTIRRVHVLWSNDADPQNHGAYGLYPVQCANVLVEDSVVEGASDAGFYIGQSKQIVVRRNTARKNVAGIEIENSHSADVYENSATDNTAGVLVFALPGLQVKDTGAVRVYKNRIVKNNRKSFAATGNVVAKVPAGTGAVVMAADQVELFGNTLDGNQTAQTAVISYLITQLPFDAKSYYPYPTRVWIHDNTYTGGGDQPDGSNSLGVVLGRSPFPNMIVSSIVYDGLLDAMRMGARPGNPMDLCLSANGNATFANVHADMMTMALTFDHLSTDATAYQCTLDPLPPVAFAGL